MAEHPDDRLDFDEPFDPRQWALHGLLMAYFERERGGYSARIDAMLERVFALDQSPKRKRGAISPSSLARGPSRALRLLRQHRRWALRGAGLAAAILLLAVYLTWSPTRPPGAAPQRQSLLPDFAAIAEAATNVALTPVPEINIALLAGDAAALRADALRNVERARAELAAARARAWQGPASLSNPDIQATLDAYPHVYRPLMDIAEWNDAEAVIGEALAFAEGGNPTERPIDEWVCIYLADLGSLSEATGDYAKARDAYCRSIAVRERVVERDVAGCQESPSGYRRACAIESRMHRVTPIYWRLSYLAVLQDDLSAAREWHQQADDSLRDYLVGVCAATGTTVDPAASLIELYGEAPKEFRNPQDDISPDEGLALRVRFAGFLPNTGLVTKLREHLYREARLRCIEGDFPGARQVLLDAARVTFEPIHDESRLDFHEPLERARIAILLHEYETALTELALAEQNSGPLSLHDANGVDVSKRAIGPLRIAEVKMLKAGALVGLSHDRREARRLIAEALAVRDAFAAPLTGQAQENFIKRFRTWDELATAAR